MVDTWHNEKIGTKVVEALKKNNFDAIYFADKEEAVEYALGFVKEGMQVAFGGSMTLKELGLPKRVEEKGAYTLNHNAPGLSAEEKLIYVDNNFFLMFSQRQCFNLGWLPSQCGWSR